MTIRAKITACFLSLCLLSTIASVYHHYRFKKSTDRVEVANQVLLPLANAVLQLQTQLYRIVEDIRRYSFPKEGSLETKNSSVILRDLYPFYLTKRFEELNTVMSQHFSQERLASVLVVIEKSKEVQEQVQSLVQIRSREAFESKVVEIKTNLAHLSKIVEEELSKISASSQSEGRENLIASYGLSLLVTLLGIVLLILSQKVLKPLPQLIQVLNKIADGDFSQNIKITGSSSDEIAELSREFNRMVNGLNERDKKIQEQQKELLKSERLAAIGHLSSEVVHEIRNPLNSMSLNVDWLQNEMQGTDEEKERTLVSIAKEIERLHQITESYLVRARVPNQTEEKVALNELLQEILEFSREEDKAKQIEVQLQLTERELFVRHDRARLKQAFLNIFKNAREAMPRGGKLTVRSEQRKNTYCVQIQDTGYGMNETTRQQTFQPFFTTKSSGTGIGLTLTKKIIEEAQGSISCESLVGQGSTFTLQFPV